MAVDHKTVIISYRRRELLNKGFKYCPTTSTPQAISDEKSSPQNNVPDGLNIDTRMEIEIYNPPADPARLDLIRRKLPQKHASTPS